MCLAEGPTSTWVAGGYMAEIHLDDLGSGFTVHAAAAACAGPGQGSLGGGALPGAVSCAFCPIRVAVVVIRRGSKLAIV